MKDSNEIKAEMRNKIQAPLLVLSDLREGKEVPHKLIEVAFKDIDELRRMIAEDK